jgi:hypothetical protein
MVFFCPTLCGPPSFANQRANGSGRGEFPKAAHQTVDACKPKSKDPRRLLATAGHRTLRVRVRDSEQEWRQASLAAHDQLGVSGHEGSEDQKADGSTQKGS